MYFNRLPYLLIILTLCSCNYYNDYQFKNEILNCCIKPETATINFLDFKTIDEYDDYQYAHILDTSAADIFIEYDNYSFSASPGIGLKSNFICDIEIDGNKLIRFGFSSNGKQLQYRGEKINYSEAKDIVTERLEDTTNIYCLPTIEIKFKDEIDKDFTTKCIKYMNDGLYKH